jgi:GAF domain-containing protein
VTAPPHGPDPDRRDPDCPDPGGPGSDRRVPDRSAGNPAEGPLDPVAAFAELSKIRLSDTDLTQVLTRVAELAKRCVPGADAVSVTLIANGHPGTVAHTDELALALDEAQYDRGYGPCLDAARTHETFTVRDMTVEQRWPDWANRAAEFGARSSISTGMPVQQTVSGALNVYSRQPDAFDAAAHELLATFAGYGAVALANAHLYTATAALADQMAQAMDTRAVIEQAKGVLISQQHINADEAFTIMVRASQRGNRKLHDIAHAIVDGATRDTSP